jgi:Mn2+/Fe2+ NRAMP family transporter
LRSPSALSFNKRLRALGAGIVTGAADDDPVAVGTYANAGAKLGVTLLWIAPLAYPLMVTVVYLGGKLGKVTGHGLFRLLSERYPPLILYPLLLVSSVANVIEAAADLGVVGAAIGLFVRLPPGVLALGVGGCLLVLQTFGTYRLIRRLFRWLSLSLLAYVGAALLAGPDLEKVLHGTLVPKLTLERESLSLLVAVLGTSLSAYVYTWQTNQEVEDKIASGKRHPEERRGASKDDLRRSRRNIALGMFFANLVMYFVMLATGTALHDAGKTEISSAAEAAEALRPLAGEGARWLFAAGIIGVGFLAIPVVIDAATYGICQSFGWPSGLGRKPQDAPRFYLVMTVITALAVSLNFLGLNAMKAVVWAGVAQAVAAPPLLFCMLIMTNDRKLMGEHVNGKLLNLIGGLALLVTSAALIALFVTWLS